MADQLQYKRNTYQLLEILNKHASNYADTRYAKQLSATTRNIQR